MRGKSVFVDVYNLVLASRVRCRILFHHLVAELERLVIGVVVTNFDVRQVETLPPLRHPFK